MFWKDAMASAHESPITAALTRTILLAKDKDVIGLNTPTDEQVVNAFRSITVSVVADESNLSSPPAQHACVTLVCLVARLGVAMRLALPEVPVLGFQAPLVGDRLRAGLLDLCRDLIPQCEATLSDNDDEVDIAFIIGDTPWSGHATLSYRLVWDEWSGAVAPTSQQIQPWRGDFPIGAMVAAGVAAPEVFKTALRKLGQSLPNPVRHDFLAPVNAAQVRVAPMSVAPTDFSLGQVDAVSGGAIVDAAMYTLLHLPNVSADFRVIDPEEYDISNLNRYPLLRQSQVGLSKVAALHGWARAGFQIDGVKAAFTSTTRSELVPLAPMVLVGTDDIPTRWEVQRERPSWLGVGATSHFLTVTSSHTLEQACAGCLHPYDDPTAGPIPTVSFVSFWAGLLLAVRLLRRVIGENLANTEQSLLCTPLRLDQARAYWQIPVAPSSHCPVRCNASKKAF